MENEKYFRNFRTIIESNGYVGELKEHHVKGKPYYTFEFFKEIISEKNTKFVMMFLVNSGKYIFKDGKDILTYLHDRFVSTQDQEFDLPEDLARKNYEEGEFIIETTQKLLNL